MIQGSNKLKNYRLWWLSKLLRLTKFESFWIQVCAIVAVLGILGDISLLSLSFLTEFFSMILLLCFSIVFSHFYSVILESRGTIDSLVLLPGYRSSFCAHRSESWAFPCFSFFLPFDVVSSKAHGWLFYSEVCLFLMSRWFNFWPSFLFFIFPEWVESNSAGSKVFCCYFHFYSSLLWFPEVLFLCIVRGYSRLSPFSCWISDTWEWRI